MRATPDGLMASRLKNDHHGRETAFAELWRRDNEVSCGGTILGLLMTYACNHDDEGAVRVLDFGLGHTHKKQPLGPPTERDQIIAATLIQWLGTNVGFDFVGRALENAGYEYPKRKESHNPASGGKE